MTSAITMTTVPICNGDHLDIELRRYSDGDTALLQDDGEGYKKTIWLRSDGRRNLVFELAAALPKQDQQLLAALIMDERPAEPFQPDPTAYSKLLLALEGLSDAEISDLRRRLCADAPAVVEEADDPRARPLTDQERMIVNLCFIAHCDDAALMRRVASDALLLLDEE